MLKIAITGNIASGKSEVENLISKFYPVYDADKLAHKVLDEIKDFYGLDVFLNGKIDRKKLGNIVFNDSTLLKKLEEIVHPKVKAEIIKLFESHKDFDDVIFVSIPLLYESGFDSLFDKVVFVSCNQQIRSERLMKRNNFTQEEAAVRIRSQQDESEKIEKADYIIFNDGSIAELTTQVDKIISIVKKIIIK